MHHKRIQALHDVLASGIAKVHSHNLHVLNHDTPTAALKVLQQKVKAKWSLFALTWTTLNRVALCLFNVWKQQGPRAAAISQ